MRVIRCVYSYMKLKSNTELGFQTTVLDQVMKLEIMAQKDKKKCITYEGTVSSFKEVSFKKNY